eukprot:GHVH01006337.1.p1 GENE.GHVH01006337.1~~GHVH01006337.1.p1  ORF type:complete len:844 (+),score=98.45 GHVH01006337.1:229-2760(+)
MLTEFESSTPGGPYQASSPMVNSSFNGKIPKIFLVAGVPMIIFFTLFQIHFMRYYVGPPVPRILKKAINRNEQSATLDRSQDAYNGQGMDDFGMVAAEIQNGSLRTIKKTLKSMEGKGNKVDRQRVAKEMFDSIMSEMEKELSSYEKQAAEVDPSGRFRTRAKRDSWDWGPVVKSPNEFPKSVTLTGANSKTVMEVLEWEYNILEKEVPFVGYDKYLEMHPNVEDKNVVDRKYTNSLVVAPWPDENRRHGLIGVDPTTGKQWWNPKAMPTVCDEEGEAECEKRLKEGGGFDLTMSDARPLDTIPHINKLMDNCQAYVESIDIKPLPDTSVVITFYNEPLSTLLRTVHSVLNTTPPSILREIILVDDHSELVDCLAGGPLDLAIKYLPKVKLLRQPERRGLVMGRIAGIHNSLGAVSVILDSHVEVNEYWLEPMLQRIVEEPKAVVFPIVAGIDQKTFEPVTASGIGTWLSWTWDMVESSSYEYPPKSIDPVPSASMAGGLFAVRRDMFFELGAYDEQMAMWGAENVEMPFRVWQCGGRVEGIPCSMTYHIYRKGGVGYKSPGGAIMMNRLRTARLWMDEWYQVSRFFILFGRENQQKEDTIIGNMDEMLTFKEDKQCKGFKWFLENIDPNHEGKEISDVLVMGAIRSMKAPNQCLDMHGKNTKGELVGTYNCHGDGASQSFFSAPNSKVKIDKSHSLISGLNSKFCINRLHPIDENMKPIEDTFGKAGLVPCNNPGELWNQHNIEFSEDPSNPPGIDVPNRPSNMSPNSVPGRLIETDTNHEEYGKRCLTKFDDALNVAGNLAYEPCRDGDISQWWWIEKPDFKGGYNAPTISPQQRRNINIE